MTIRNNSLGPCSPEQVKDPGLLQRLSNLLIHGCCSLSSKRASTYRVVYILIHIYVCMYIHIYIYSVFRSLNSLKAGYTGGYIWEYCKAY